MADTRCRACYITWPPASERLLSRVCEATVAAEVLMPTLAAASSRTVQLIESGPNFELWKGRDGAMTGRLDWNQRAAVRVTVNGHGHGTSHSVISRWEAATKQGDRLIIIDFGTCPRTTAACVFR